MANNVDINLRARNQASQALRDVAADVEVLAERLASSGGLSDATATAAENIERLADTSQRLEVLTLSIGAVAAAVGAVKLATRTLAAPVNEYVEWTSATKGLTESQLEYIDVLERAVGTNDIVSAELLGLAASYGIVEDKQDDVVTGAVGLAESLDGNLSSILLKLSDFLQGNEKALDSVIPQLREMETAQERLTEIERLAIAGLEDKQAAMGDLEGAQLRYSDALEDMARIIGEVVAPAATVLLNIAAALANAIGNLLHAAMGRLHRDFKTFTADMLDGAALTEFFELGILSLEKTFVQLNQAFAELANHLGFAGPELNAFLTEVDLRLADIDRRADEAMQRRFEAERDAAEEVREPLRNLLNFESPGIPEFKLTVDDAIKDTLKQDDKKDVAFDDTTLVAFESRLLNSSSTVSAADATARNTEKSASALNDLVKLMRDRGQLPPVELKVNQA